MTQEEIVRFALMLRESDRVRAMIAEDEAAETSGESLPQEIVLEAA